MEHNRRGFFRMLMAAPIAIVTAAGLWKPRPIRYVKYMGTMRITGDAMRRLEGKPDAFLKWTEQYLEEMRKESDRFFGYHGDVEGAEAMNRLLDGDIGVRG